MAFKVILGFVKRRNLQTLVLKRGWAWVVKSVGCT